MTAIRKIPGGGMIYPPAFNFKTDGFGLDSGFFLEDGTTDKIAVTIECPVSGTLDTFEFLFLDTAVTVDPTTTMKISFQDLDASGIPDEVADQYRIINVNNFFQADNWCSPGLITSDGTDTGTKRQVTRGQRIAVVFEFDTVVSGDIVSIATIAVRDDGFRRSKGFYNEFGNSWSLYSYSHLICGTLKYDPILVDANLELYQRYWYTPECLPITELEEYTLNTGTDPDEQGVVFFTPANVRIGGALMCLSAPTGTNFECVLYDNPNGGIQPIETVSMTLRTDLFPVGSYTYWYAKFTQDQYISVNQPYRLMVKPTTATSIKLLALRFFDGDMGEELFGWRDSANNRYSFRLEWRNNGGTFSDNDNPQVIPLISFLVTGIENAGESNDWTGDA